MSFEELREMIVNELAKFDAVSNYLNQDGLAVRAALTTIKKKFIFASSKEELKSFLEEYIEENENGEVEKSTIKKLEMFVKRHL